MEKKYFFFDIDGTLLSETNHEMPESCAKTLRLLEAQGHFVAVATSRPYVLTKDEMEHMHIKNFVCDGGDGLVIENQVIEILPLPYKQTHALCQECLHHHIPIATSVDTTNNRYSPDDTFITLYPKLKNAFHFITQPGFNVLEAKQIHKMCIYCFKEDEIKLPSLKSVPHYRLDEAMILVEAIDKYKGIEKMMEYLNAPLEDVVVFGDGTNDLTMFQKAPFSIAMGNAVQPLKNIASFVTKNASDDGIEYACRYFGWI